MEQTTAITNPSHWRRLRPYSIIEVKWEDAKQVAGEHTLAVASEVKPCYRYSSGYVVRFDREYCVIAQTDDRATEKASGEHRGVCDILQIPVDYVREVTLLATAVRR